MLRLHPDGSPAEWLDKYLAGIGPDVRSLIPEIYESYARVLHPAERNHEGVEEDVSWAEVATHYGKRIHPEVQWRSFEVAGATTKDATAFEIFDPSEGSLPKRQVAPLATLLARHTTNPSEAWFCVWAGWGALAIRPEGTAMLTRGKGPGRIRRMLAITRSARPRRQPSGDPGPQVHFPGRDYFLFSGATQDATQSYAVPPFWQSPNMWWPDDRAWFVATEIDLMSTYVGGTKACIADLLAAEALEVLEVYAQHGIAWGV